MDAHCFVDGGHLREISRRTGRPLVDPRKLSAKIAYSELVQQWRTHTVSQEPKRFHGQVGDRIGLARVLYYDAWPEDGAPEPLQEYWRAIEMLPDTEIGFGTLRGKPRRQKRVDTLIAVDMLVGAFSGIFKVGILVAADADFVPVVEAVRRRGVMVVVAGAAPGLSDELRRAADRVWVIDPKGVDEFLPMDRPDAMYWLERPDGTIKIGRQ